MSWKLYKNIHIASLICSIIFYAERESQNAAGLNESELMELAVKSLGLADLRPFDYKKRVIEYLL